MTWMTYRLHESVDLFHLFAFIGIVFFSICLPHKRGTEKVTTNEKIKPPFSHQPSLTKACLSGRQAVRLNFLRRSWTPNALSDLNRIIYDRP
jgi:hypothetical protein